MTFHVSNDGTLSHDFEICSVPTANDSANSCEGSTTPVGVPATLMVTFSALGTYEYLCTIPGQAEAGMKGLLKVS